MTNSHRLLRPYRGVIHGHISHDCLVEPPTGGARASLCATYALAAVIEDRSPNGYRVPILSTVWWI